MFSLEGIEPNASYWIWLALAVLMGRRYGYLPAATFAWISFSAFRLFAAPISPYVGEEEVWSASLSLAAASAWIGVVAAMTTAKMFSIRFWRFLGLANAAMIIGGTFFGQPCGILANASMSGCMQAVLFPLFFERRGKIPMLGTFLIPISILITCKNQPIALFFLLIGISLLRRKAWKELIIAACISILTGYFIIGHMFGNSEGRVELWKMAFDFWSAHANPFLGMGLGTFYYIGPWMTLKPFGQGFLWLHSDWMQIGFECGVVGLLLVSALFLKAVIRARRSEALCSSLLLYGAWCVANFPLHNPISALLGAYLIVLALQLPTETLLK